MSKGKQKFRVLYGPAGQSKPYWECVVIDAKKDVLLAGSAIAALTAIEGVSVGCAFSNFGMENKSAFPHPVYLVAVTKTCMYVVDKMDKSGTPCRVVRYVHRHGKITELNDEGTLKALVEADPTVVERTFKFSAPNKRERIGRSHHRGTPGNRRPVHRSGGGAYGAHAPRGALRRAVKAGLIGTHVVDQLIAA